MNKELTLFELPEIENKVPSFYNTVGHKGNDLAERIQKAKCQDLKILEIVKSSKGMSAYVILKKIESLPYEKPMLITSIRRSLTGLCKAGKIIDSGTKRPTPYGSQEIIYIIKN